MEKQSSSTILFTDRVLVSGMTGTGKTYFTKWFIKTHLLGKIKVLVWDPLWQYQDLGIVHHSLPSISGELTDLKRAIVFQPDPESDNEKTFDAVAKFVMDRGHIYFIAEEFAYYTPELTARLRSLGYLSSGEKTQAPPRPAGRSAPAALPAAGRIRISIAS